jgi:hypothetical protein
MLRGMNGLSEESPVFLRGLPTRKWLRNRTAAKIVLDRAVATALQ